jgi:RNA polymerase sigma-70 factor, ECF subfamily
MTSSFVNSKAEEAELVARIRAGDEGACETLVRTYSGVLLSVARRFLRCEAESADALQEAFILAFGAVDSFEGNCALGSWLHRIVVNRSLRRLQVRKRRRTVSLDDLPRFDEYGRQPRPGSPGVSAPESQLARAEMRAQVRACIDRLPAAYRTVLVLWYIEEFDTDQTAVRLGSTPGAVKTRLHRARQALRALLEPILHPGEASRQRAEA